MGSPRLHSRWIDVIALLFVPWCSDSMFVLYPRPRTKVNYPKSRQPMRTVARRGPADSDPDAPLARSVVPRPYQHPSPDGKVVGATALYPRSENVPQHPSLNDAADPSSRGYDATASNPSNENIHRHQQPSMIDRTYHSPHHSRVIGATESYPSSENVHQHPSMTVGTDPSPHGPDITASNPNNENMHQHQQPSMIDRTYPSASGILGLDHRATASKTHTEKSQIALLHEIQVVCGKP